MADLVVLPEAVDDALQAYGWYEERQIGLGEYFLTCVDDCIDRICRNPQLFEQVYKDYRRAIVRRFPYVVFFEHDDTRTVIYSLFHSAQDPGKWRQRLK